MNPHTIEVDTETTLLHEGSFIMSNKQKKDAQVSIQKILEASKIIFAEKGFHKTTLSEIGESCGLARSTPSYYFKNKENLYRAVINQLIDEEKKYVSKLTFENEVSIEALKDLLSRHMSYTFKNPYLSKMIIWESLDKNRHIWIQDYFPEMINWSHFYLAQAQNHGLLRKDVDTYTLWLNAMAMAWLPIITEHTFMKSIDRNVKDPSFIEFHQKQVEKLIFDTIIQ